MARFAAATYAFGRPRRSGLPSSLAGSGDLGRFRVLDATMTEGVKKLLWPLELDRIPPESSLKTARRDLTEKEQQSVDKAVDRFLSAQIERIATLSQGKPAELLLAYDKAASLYLGYED